jgi:trk system potassium uptake protein
MIGILLMFEGIFMLLGVPFSVYYGGDDLLVLIIAAGITYLAGGICWYLSHRELDRNMGKREVYIMVSFVWIIISAFGTLPYLFSGVIPDFTNAFFETISGFSTTGASVIKDVEIIPKGILFWRSMTHWMGGMGIIVLSVAILPFLGTGGMQLFSSEASGQNRDKLNLRIRNTAINLWGIYVLLTLIETALLTFGGMNLFDALCHSFSTLSTGGFSTRNASMAAFSPYCQYVVIFFMIIAAINFTLYYFLWKGSYKRLLVDEELRIFIGIILGTGIFISLSLIIHNHFGVEQAIRDGFFQVASIISSTGFTTTDYTIWPSYLWVILFLLMFIGGCAGSTSGAFKVMRFSLLFKSVLREFKKLVHPNAIIPVRFNKQVVSEDIISKVLVFVILYLGIFIISSLILSITGVDFVTAIGSVASTIGGVGPGLNKTGPIGNYSEVPAMSKWVLSCCMLLGRLELFSVLILFAPALWRR